mmetsp:Transcript_13480/g.17243  ORF Transcript_13480/g.17243 Transcript_13480/m.17243 type:complete len:357 (+) Transcript_13480:2594-3664(+)
MVFVQNSSEHTAKVVLNSNLRIPSSTASYPKYNLLVPIRTPAKQVALASIESAMIKAPSLISSGVINDDNNQIYLSDGSNFNYYNANVAPVFSNFIGVDLTQAENAVALFEAFVGSSDDRFAITIKGDPLSADSNYVIGMATQTETDGSVTYWRYIQQGSNQQTEYETDGTTKNESYTAFKNEIKTRLNLMNRFSFTLTNTSTSVIALGGPWLKIFNLYNVDTGRIISPQNSVFCELQNEGYSYINVHTNFGRSVHTCTGDHRGIVPTDMFWTIPIVAPPSQLTYYTNNSSSGKIPYHFPVLDEITLYFTDPWNDPVTDIEDFILNFTFDFASKEDFVSPETLLKARDQLTNKLLV